MYLNETFCIRFVRDILVVMIGKIRLLFWIGMIVLFIPYFGIPNTWKNIALGGIGIILILISFRMRKVYKSMKFRLRRFEQSVPAEDIIHE